MKRLLLLFIALLGAGKALADDNAFEFSLAGGDKSQAIVSGWNKEDLAALAELAADWEPSQWQSLLAVFVDSQADTTPIAVLGEHRIEGGAVVFAPRFPFQPGLKYRLVLNVGGSSVAKVLSLPAPPPTKPTSVVHVYPSRNVLPENQLKFYLHFSAPMSRRESYRNLHLLRSDGSEVDAPFLELGEELWDESGRRFTLFFDPGRIKRGLKPREEFGPSLEEGREYTLVVDRTWRDAAGKPLSETFRKNFKVIAPDDVQPDPQKWRQRVPDVSTVDPLVIRFPESLDHAMLQRVLTVIDENGRALPGEVAVDRQETRWSFTPAQPWKAGRYQLVVATTLEDLAGNSIGRPFEVDTWGKTRTVEAAPMISLPFTVK